MSLRTRLDRLEALATTTRHRVSLSLKNIVARVVGLPVEARDELEVLAGNADNPDNAERVRGEFLRRLEAHGVRVHERGGFTIVEDENFYGNRESLAGMSPFPPNGAFGQNQAENSVFPESCTTLR